MKLYTDTLTEAELRKINRLTVSDRDLWQTPNNLFKAVVLEMGSEPLIDLCASEENRKAKFYIGLDKTNVPNKDIQDSVNQGGRGLLSVRPELVAEFVEDSWVWMNPPYSRGHMPVMTRWIRKFAEAGGKACILTPASQSDGWWVENLDPVLIATLVPEIRVQFIPPEGIFESSNSGFNLVSVVGKKTNGLVEWKRLRYKHLV